MYGEAIFKLDEIYSNLKDIETKKEFIPKLLYTNNKVVDRLLVDMIDKGIDRIIVDNNSMYEYILRILKNMNKEDIQLQIKDDVFNIYDIKKQLEKLENRKIWLKCGGFITIDKTEALTAIDVNTGKYTGKKDLNDTILTVNKEATIEIAKQLKIRDIGGIVIVDYIDMNEENRKKILDIFNECIKSDRSKVQIVGFTPLNLLELTRKHMWS
ncbi:MAG: ribonuclease E/G [Clostridia bacterium]|nr:ribonuclease E/G [Clostridia bacterium]